MIKVFWKRSLKQTLLASFSNIHAASHKSAHLIVCKALGKFSNETTNKAKRVTQQLAKAISILISTHPQFPSLPRFQLAVKTINLNVQHKFTLNIIDVDIVQFLSSLEQMRSEKKQLMNNYQFSFVVINYGMIAMQLRVYNNRM